MRNWKRFCLLCVSLPLAFFVLLTNGGGCGGSGGTGGGGQEFAAIFVAIETLSGQQADGYNLRVGDKYQMILIGFTSTGIKQEIPGTNWQLTVTEGTPGTLDSSTGEFTALGEGKGIISAQYADDPSQSVFPLEIVVHDSSKKAAIVGSVFSDSGASTEGMILEFFDSSNASLGKATVLSSKSIKAYVPLDTTKVNFVFGIPGDWVGMWSYKDHTYTANDKTYPDCHALLQLDKSLQPGQTSNMGQVFVIFINDPPPPPPDGCKGG
ncbi:MAG TPA: hypothetical protein VNK96_00335 [Fimbriimonadales bacterium]|nr:hypothetical protein [Fimbriimonadales bacterium]